MSPLENLDLKFDNRSILEWYADAKKEGKLDRNGLRRSLIARLIWLVSYQRPYAIIETVRMVMGWRNDENPRRKLAEDIWILRKATKNHHRPLTYSWQPARRGFHFRGRPLLDPRLVQGIRQGAAQVNPRRIAIMRRKTIAERFEIGFKLTDGYFAGEAFRLRIRYPDLSQEETLRLARQDKHELPRTLANH